MPRTTNRKHYAEVITVKVRPHQLGVWRAAAATVGMSLSELVRRGADAHAADLIHRAKHDAATHPARALAFPSG